MGIRIYYIDYTVYPPDFKPGESPCWDFRTFSKAKRKAKGLGTGARVYRNFNRSNRRQPLGEWWGHKCFWRWSGSTFERMKETGEQVGTEIRQELGTQAAGGNTPQVNH